ncbi:MAG: hypothetical protein H6624_06020 [Bdellovibrionaceae bacterium]|nr:hypothetical protein [Bdellovibrionales bacterium]MCB9083879.1 hypothetical protein [Pseudobdellovibrionaceae bacterium]
MENSILADRIERVLELARWYPSGDNCQPFRFRITKDRLQIFHSEVKARHILNGQNHASCLSLGALLEYLVVAATDFDLEPVFELFESNFLSTEELSLWAEVAFAERPLASDPLVPLLSQRRTERRPFSGEIDLAKVHSVLEEGKKDHQEVDVHLLSSPSEEFKSHCVAGETLMWCWPELNRAIFDWVCLKNPQCSEGMPFATLGALISDYPLIYLLKNYPGTFGFFRSMGFYAVPKGRVKKTYDRGPAFFAVSTPELSSCNMIKVGQMSCRKWLRLQAEGYSVQPLTLPALGPSFIDTAGLPVEVGEIVRQMQTSLNHLKQEFALKSQWQLAWMFRVGKAKGKQPAPPSYRHSVKELLV